MADDIIPLDDALNQLFLSKNSNLSLLQKPTMSAGAARGSQLIANDLYRTALGLPEIGSGNELTNQNLNQNFNIPNMQSMMPPEMAAQSAKEIEAEIAERGITPSFAEILKANNISNDGAPLSIRRHTGFYNFDNPKVYRSQLESKLKEYFKNEGLITDEFDFGLRTGPITERLEFRDPRRGGQYTVVDPIGGIDTVTGDFLDISGEAVTVAGEVGGGIAGLPTTSVSGPIGPAVTSAAGAFVATYGRLITGYLNGDLPEQITHQDIIQKAMSDSGWAIAGGAGGALAYKLARPLFLKLTGQTNLPSKLEDLDLDTFNNAHKMYMNSDEAKILTQAGVQPSVSQVAEFASKKAASDPSTSTLDAAKFQNLASETAALESTAAKNPDNLEASSIINPKMASIIAGQRAVDEANLSGSSMSKAEVKDLGGFDAQKLGENILNDLAIDKAVAAKRHTDKALQLKNDLDDKITQALNITDDVDLDTFAFNVQSVFQKYADDGLKNLKDDYTELFESWSKATGVNLDDAVAKPTFAISKVRTLLKNLENNILSNELTTEINLLKGILDNAQIGGSAVKGAAVKIKDMSIKELNDTVLTLRKIERKAYSTLSKGGEAADAKLINEVTTVFENERNRIMKKLSKGQDLDITSQIQSADDTYTDFMQSVLNKKKSTIKNILDSNKPKNILNLLKQPEFADSKTLGSILKLPENSNIIYDLRNVLLQEYSDKVFKKDNMGVLAKVDRNQHDVFMKKYGKLMENYFPEELLQTGIAAEPRKIASLLNDIIQNEKTALAEVKTKFNLSDIRNPDDVFNATWEVGLKDRITNFSKIKPILDNNPSLKKTYKGFVLKDMFSAQDQNLRTVNGIQTYDPKVMLKYVDDNKDQLKSLFGRDYVNNINSLNKAIDAVLNEPKPRSIFSQQTPLIGFVRAYLGVFTRPGRFVTAVDILRKNAGKDVLPKLLADPNKLAATIKLARLTTMEKITSQEFGRIMSDVMLATDNTEIANIVSRTESDLEQANLKEKSPSVVYPALTEKALQLDYDL
jgi:hypothetical protein